MASWRIRSGPFSISCLRKPLILEEARLRETPKLQFELLVALLLVLQQEI